MSGRVECSWQANAEALRSSHSTPPGSGSGWWVAGIRSTNRAMDVTELGVRVLPWLRIGLHGPSQRRVGTSADEHGVKDDGDPR
jgi:hypothetical protein